MEEELLKLVFSEDGLIAQVLEDYELREGQIGMASQILKAYQNDQIALCEAGTGIGKSLAYLAAAMLWASRKKERSVISTHTITLQHQLIEKDIPFLQNALDLDLKVVLVKGMQNYLCLRKLDDAEDENQEHHALKLWANKTKTGCKTTLPFTVSPSNWDRFACDSMSCTSAKCPHFRDCFFFKARKEAEEAQLVVVNHSLLLTDIRFKDKEKGILPKYQRLIIDEAHRLEDVAIQVFSKQSDWIGLIKLINSFPLELEGQKAESLKKLEAAFFSLREVTRETKTPWQETWQTTLKEPFEQAAKAMLKWCVICRNHCKNNEENPLIPPLADELETHAEFLLEFFDPKTLCVRWVEKKTNTILLVEAPLDAPEKLKHQLFGTLKTAGLCSATLCQGKDFSFLKKQLGLDAEESITEAVFDSPFDYEKRTFFAVVSNLCEPSDPQFTAKAADAIEQLIVTTLGGSLVLFTSLDMLHAVYQMLKHRPVLQDYTILRQGDLGRSALLQTFIETKKAALFGVDSFWEGLDIAGSALRLVIIVKLPFHALGDPYIEAVQAKIDQAGGSSFYEYSVPRAAIKFKQAFGRLMRKKEDRGAVVCLDKRIYTKSYGKKFLSALPSCSKLFKPIEEIKQTLKEFGA